jgi:hypothetical protein
MADKPKSLFTESERHLLDVQQRRDMAELHPDGPEARQIREESQRTSLYADAPVGSKLQNPNEREERNNVTPEQKERVDQALGKSELSAQIGGASDVNAKPAPNEPTPMEKSRELGQDLQRQGVTMDKDK